MKNFYDKLRIIYLPFLLIAAGFVLGYSFLNWLFLIRLGWLRPDEELVNFWLPYTIPWIPVWIWLTPRLKALRFAKSIRDPVFLYRLAAVFAIAVPTMVGQSYLQTAGGTLTPLSRLSEIEEVPKTKYYTLHNVILDKANASAETSLRRIGKNGQYLVMNVFLACPMEDSEIFRAPGGRYFLGTTYTHQTSSNISAAEREAQFQAFLKTSEENYRGLDLSRFTYLERVGTNDEGRGLKEAVKRNRSFESDHPVTLLRAHQDNFETRNGNKLVWVFRSFGIGALVWFVLLLVVPVNRPEMNRLLRGEKAPAKPAMPAYKLFIPNSRFFVTPIVTELNFLVFLGMVFAGMGVVSFATRDLLALGGDYRPAVLDGQVWRLLTSMFVHAGLMHVLSNMVTLFLLGVMLEPVFGPVRFGLCYFASGLTASVASLYWHPAAVSVGASGGIFGLMGAILGFSLLNRSPRSFSRKHLLGFVLLLIGYNLLLGFVSPGTDNAAHLGGLACGILFGLFFNLFPGMLPKNAT